MPSRYPLGLMALALFRCGLLSHLRPIGRCARSRPCRRPAPYHMHDHTCTRPRTVRPCIRRTHAHTHKRVELARDCRTPPRRGLMGRVEPARARAVQPRTPSSRAVLSRESYGTDARGVARLHPPAPRLLNAEPRGRRARATAEPPLMPIACARALRVPRRCLGCSRRCLRSVRLCATKTCAHCRGSW